MIVGNSTQEIGLVETAAHERLHTLQIRRLEAHPRRQATPFWRRQMHVHVEAAATPGVDVLADRAESIWRTYQSPRGAEGALHILQGCSK